MLSVRPDLSWRDLQYLALQTAVPVTAQNADWQVTSIGKKFSHRLGYGKLDAYAIVEAAKEFKSVKAQAWYDSPLLHVDQNVPEGDQGLASTLQVTKEDLRKANLERLEHVTVTMNVAHSQRGDVSVELRSPAGMVSYLSATRRHDDSTYGYVDWTFMSVVHWYVLLSLSSPVVGRWSEALIVGRGDVRGENGIGNWTVIVKDTVVNGKRGTFQDWKMTLWGECIDESKASLLPMPTEKDDDDDDAVETVSASRTSISAGISPTPTVTENPTDHPGRPVNAKPTKSEGGEATGALTSTPSPISSASSVAAADKFLPSFFPTFGVSKRTQIWIYGSVAIIALFCIAIGTYLFIARRRRIRNNVRDDYEFEVLADQDDEDDGTGGAARKAARRRGGELYDAFAEESDEDLSTGDGEKYWDGNEQEAAKEDPGGSGDGESLLKR